MTRFTTLVIFCYFALYGQSVVGTVTNEFFPFGLENGDSKLRRADDVAEQVLFQENFEFYGQSYSSFYVSLVYYLIIYHGHK